MVFSHYSIYFLCYVYRKFTYRHGWGSSFLMHMNWIPEDATLMITDFMQDGGFLNFYIAGLITGSILSINSKVLIKAGTRFLIPLFFGVATAILIGGTIGALIGNGFIH